MKITLLSEQTSDCFLVTVGNEDRPTHILIDGGLAADQKDLVEFCKTYFEKGKVIDLIILTHVDGDHIGGLLYVLAQNFVTADFIRQVWFNSKCPIRLSPVDENSLDITYAQGNKLTQLLTKKNIPTYSAVANATSTKVINDLCEITILAPSQESLDELIDEWPSDENLDVSADRADHLQEWDILRRTEGFPDGSKKNRSSVVVLIYCKKTEKKALFTGDSVPTEIFNFIDTDPIAIDLFKLPHHGSKRNINSALIRKFPSSRYLVTAGTKGHKPHKKSLQVLVDNVSSPFDLYIPSGNWVEKTLALELAGYGCVLRPYRFNHIIEL